jgi:DNA-binding XRE family transcriptional regulator
MKLEDEYNSLLRKIAGNIKRLRNEKGITQEEMTKFGFSYRHYQKIESGAYSPNFFTLFRVSKAFKVKISDLLD